MAIYSVNWCNENGDSSLTFTPIYQAKSEEDALGQWTKEIQDSFGKDFQATLMSVTHHFGGEYE